MKNFNKVTNVDLNDGEWDIKTRTVAINTETVAYIEPRVIRERTRAGRVVECKFTRIVFISGSDFEVAESPHDVWNKIMNSIVSDSNPFPEE